MKRIKSLLNKIDDFYDKLSIILKKIKLSFKFRTLFKQKIRINTLTLENEELKKENKKLELALKDKLYEEFINKYKEPELIEKLEKENKRLKSNNRELKKNIKRSE